MVVVLNSVVFLVLAGCENCVLIVIVQLSVD